MDEIKEIRKSENFSIEGGKSHETGRHVWFQKQEIQARHGIKVGENARNFPSW